MKQLKRLKNMLLGEKEQKETDEQVQQSESEIETKTKETETLKSEIENPGVVGGCRGRRRAGWESGWGLLFGLVQGRWREGEGGIECGVARFILADEVGGDGRRGREGWSWHGACN